MKLLIALTLLLSFNVQAENLNVVSDVSCSSSTRSNSVCFTETTDEWIEKTGKRLDALKARLDKLNKELDELKVGE